MFTLIAEQERYRSLNATEATLGVASPLVTASTCNLHFIIFIISIVFFQYTWDAHSLGHGLVIQPVESFALEPSFVFCKYLLKNSRNLHTLLFLNLLKFLSKDDYQPNICSNSQQSKTPVYFGYQLLPPRGTQERPKSSTKRQHKWMLK